MATNATETWQTCMIALDCGDLHGASDLELALDADRRLSGAMLVKFSLRDYAARMRHAIAYRAKGDVAEALRWEDSANRIYRQIPKTWRW